MRLPIIALFLSLLPLPAWAQAIVTSPGPDSTSVTVYRDPERGEGGIDARFPTGFALVSEKRRIALPAGEATIRFEGVADGIIAVSAIVSGLPGGVVEKNRDALLLSPAALLDGTLGNRVHLRRTDRASGRVTEYDAIIRSGAEGAVVLQTAQGVEALRCSGLPETLIYDSVPPGLSAKPTLSVTTRSPAAGEAEVRLTYLTSGFDWGANYVARVAPDGRMLDLFSWLTVANGNDTGFADSQLLAVAGRLDRESGNDRKEALPSPFLDLQCWPMATTGTDMTPPPPAPPPAPMADFEIVVTAQRRMEGLVAAAPLVAQQEDLGDLKLYRVPMRVDVNAHGQKQVALLHRAAVPFSTYYAIRIDADESVGDSRPLTRMIRMRNREEAGLGLPLPSGGIALFEEKGDESLLSAEGRMRDHAIGETVEVEAGKSPQVRLTDMVVEARSGEGRHRLELSNALDHPVAIELLISGTVRQPSRKLGAKDGAALWAITLPANGRASLSYVVRKED